VQAQWFNNLPKAEQEDFKKIVLGSQKVLDRLKEICYNTIQNGVVSKETDYDCPSWAYKQADKAGYLRAYNEILQLVSLDKRK
jgi:hypothetical protein